MMGWMKLYQVPKSVKKYFDRRKLLRELFLTLENHTESKTVEELKEISARLSSYINDTLTKGISITGYSRADLTVAIILYLGVSTEEFIHMMRI